MPTIEYFYSAHSAYAYLGHPRLLDICAKYDCQLIHRPMNLSPVIRAAADDQPGKRSQKIRDYFFGRELERWSELRGLDMVPFRPTFHDAPLDLSNGLLIAAVQAKANVDALAFALFQAHWRDDIDLSDPAALTAAAAQVDIDAAPLLEVAMSDDIQTIHAQNTEMAIAKGVPGSPAYFLDGDLYYGQDHLDILERAIVQSFGPSRFYKPET